jgi:hypothetical protein
MCWESGQVPCFTRVRKRVTERLQGVNIGLFMNDGTETLVQYIIGARVGGRKEETCDPTSDNSNERQREEERETR